METSWANTILTVQDNVKKRHDDQHRTEADSCFPAPISVTFKPKKNVSYCSRFRFSCEFGNAFDIIVLGQGTYEENEHKPLQPVPR